MNGKKRSVFDNTNEYREQYNNGKGIIYEIVYEILSSKNIENGKWCKKKYDFYVIVYDIGNEEWFSEIKK